MQIPVQVAFKDLPHSAILEAQVLDEASKLEVFFDRITSCRVTVAAPGRHHRAGAPYSVRLDLTVPGGEIVINRRRGRDERHADPTVAVHDAFHAARRKLEDHARKIRGDVKQHAAP